MKKFTAVVIVGLLFFAYNSVHCAENKVTVNHLSELTKTTLDQSYTPRDITKYRSVMKKILVATGINVVLGAHFLYNNYYFF